VWDNERSFYSGRGEGRKYPSQPASLTLKKWDFPIKHNPRKTEEGKGFRAA
jgi:hypothetical protein